MTDNRLSALVVAAFDVVTTKGRRVGAAGSAGAALSVAHKASIRHPNDVIEVREGLTSIARFRAGTHVTEEEA